MPPQRTPTAHLAPRTTPPRFAMPNRRDFTKQSTADGEGMPLGRQTLIENGVLKQLTYSRFWAKKQNKTPTGGPSTFKMEGRTQSIDDLIGGTTRRVLATRLWYLREVDPRTILYTGRLTRDGTFLVENGKITKSLRNFRFNGSPLFMLNNLDDLSWQITSASTSPPSPLAPSHVKGFHPRSSQCPIRCSHDERAPRLQQATRLRCASRRHHHRRRSLS